MDTPLNPQDPLNPSEGSGEHPKDVLAEKAPKEAAAAPEPVVAPTAAKAGVTIPAAPSSPAAHVDLGKILLPKKEVPGHTVLSAQRINAGQLLDQEVKAAAEGIPKNITPEEKIAAAKPTLASVKKEDEPMVRPLETYQGDIESIVQNNNVSVLSIATAEAERRSEIALPTKEDTEAKQKKRTRIITTAMIAVGAVLFIAAAGVFAYWIARPTSVPIEAAATPDSPYINTDTVKDITITPDESRNDVMNNLNAARQATSLSLGLMSQLLVTESSSTPSGEVLLQVPAQDFFTMLTPNIPASLARTFEPNYLLGVHEYDGEQPFIILKVYSYEEAYAGMLAWEPYMKADLMPLFNYTPTQHVPEENVAATTQNTNGQLLQSGFVDKIVENHDTRALVNDSGDMYLLWTFVDRNTLVITTNDATLREIITRLKDAPITPIPGQ